ncbi:hypothetical protein BZK24_08550, partial [Helicobacter pylori]
FLIMDRWAHYFPQTMKTKEKRTIMSLIKAVIEQTKMETKALDRMDAHKFRKKKRRVDPKN